ncbi:MAG: PQQ-like beta-propeller repeat protein [Candidatus Helarchaeota archaeon]|nr:PQQ-like beta-propeller repeat protein [Candidatus Helarchaeota archaeon]
MKNYWRDNKTILAIVFISIISIGAIGTSFYVICPFLQNSQRLSNMSLGTSGESEVIWNAMWDGGSTDFGYGVVRSSDGFVYCVGYTENTSYGAGLEDLVLIKFDSNGTKIWNVTWGGDSNDRGYGVDTDVYGFIYCVGYTESFGMGYVDLALVKYASNGTKIWNVTWGGIGEERGYDISVNSNGFLYCIGSTDRPIASSTNFALVKFNMTTGKEIWNTTWGGSGVEVGEGIVEDITGYVYCCGYTSSFGAGMRDFAIVKFNPNLGTKIWNITWGGPNEEWARGITKEYDNDTLYCVGDTMTFGAGSNDLALVKINSTTGNRIWNITWGGSSAEYGEDVDMDNNGNIYAVGLASSYGGSYQIAVVKFDPNGNYQWKIIWGSALYYDHGYDLVVLGFDTFYCVGTKWTASSAGAEDLVLVRFTVPTAEEEPIPGIQLIFVVIALTSIVIFYLRRRYVLKL